MIDHWQPEWTKSIFYTVMAGIGGALGLLWRESSMGRSVTLFKLMLATAVAMFTGFHTLFLLREYGFSENLIGAINGLAAFAGVEVTLRIFDKLVLKRLGMSYEQHIAKNLVAAGWTPPPGLANVDTLQPVPIFEGKQSATSESSLRSGYTAEDAEFSMDSDRQNGDGNARKS
jgi:hypothetical protein